MRRSVVVGEGEFRPGHAVRRVKHAEAEARCEEALHRAINVFARKEAILNGEGQRAEFRAAA